MTNEIKAQKTITELLQEVRNELYKSSLTKKGMNKHLGFKYFELEDFVPLATKLFNERGMCPVFNIKFIDGIEYAVMTLYHGAEQLQFTLPTAEAINSNNPIQNLGSKASYMRRYLYLSVLDLCENDTVDASNPEEIKSVEPRKATAKQISMLKDLYDEENQKKILAYYKTEKLEDLTLAEASEAIDNKRNKK